MADDALYRLLAWLSPSYPVGAYSYSHGIETAVAEGLVGDADALTEWIGAILEHGAGQSDAILLAHSHRAAAALDGPALGEVAEVGAALKPSFELARETTAQGEAFLSVTRAVWPCPALELLRERWPGPVVYPVAVGAAAGGHGIPLDQALPTYLQAFAANLVSAGVRLIPLGQTEGQRALAALAPAVYAAAEGADGQGLEDIGTAASLAEWCSMRHEEQYTRLFRS
jgi:urease accessory protein